MLETPISSLFLQTNAVDSIAAISPSQRLVAPTRKSTCFIVPVFCRDSLRLLRDLSKGHTDNVSPYINIQISLTDATCPSPTETQYGKTTDFAQIKLSSTCRETSKARVQASRIGRNEFLVLFRQTETSVVAIGAKYCEGLCIKQLFITRTLNFICQNLNV